MPILLVSLRAESRAIFLPIEVTLKAVLSCLIPRLLVVVINQLEILVTALPTSWFTFIDSFLFR